MRAGCSLGLSKAGKPPGFCCHMSNSWGMKADTFAVLSKIARALWVQIKSFICFALRTFCWRPRRRVLLNYFSPLSTLEDTQNLNQDNGFSCPLFGNQLCLLSLMALGTANLREMIGEALAPMNFCHQLQDSQALPHRHPEISKKMHQCMNPAPLKNTCNYNRAKSKQQFTSLHFSIISFTI